MSYRLVTVLTPRVLTQQDVDSVVSFVRNLADSVTGQDFDVVGQRFNCEVVDLKDELEEDLRGVVINQWQVQGALRLVAHTSGATSQVLLGVIATRLAQMLDGWIALDGLMNQVTENPAVLTYDGVDGRVTTKFGTDVISPAVMGYWLGFEDFRLM